MEEGIKELIREFTKYGAKIYGEFPLYAKGLRQSFDNIQCVVDAYDYPEISLPAPYELDYKNNKIYLRKDGVKLAKVDIIDEFVPSFDHETIHITGIDENNEYVFVPDNLEAIEDRYRNKTAVILSEELLKGNPDALMQVSLKVYFLKREGWRFILLDEKVKDSDSIEEVLNKNSIYRKNRIKFEIRKYQKKIELNQSRINAAIERLLEMD